MTGNAFENLPQGWELKTLGEVCEFKSGYTPKKNELCNNGNIPYFKISDMNAPNNEKYMQSAQLFLKGDTNRVFPQNSIIFPKNGGAIFTNKKRILVKNSVVDLNTAILMPKPNIDLDYIFNFILSVDLGAFLKGSILPTIDTKSFLNLKIPLPPLEIQKAIVEKLENAFAHIDEAVRHLKAVQTNIPRFKSSLLHCAFNGKLTESPICHSEGEARRISKDSTLRDISLVSQAQYDTIALTQNQIAFSKYPAFIYIVSNKNNTTLYIGVTSNLQKRIYEHKNHLHKGFSDKYNCEKLVYFESFDNINQAIEREKYLKGKKRAFKENLINAINPKWLDLYGYLFGDISHFSNAQYDKATCHSEALGEVSQEIFRCAQNDKGDNLPQGWEIKTLGEVFKVIGGGTPSTANPKFWSGDIAWITSANIASENFTITPQKFINQEAIKSSVTKLVPKNTIIVVTRVGLGKVGITDVETCFSQDSQALLPLMDLNVKFMAFQIKHKAQNFIVSSRGTTINGITKDTLKNVALKIPPLATQNQIVQILESKFAHLEKLAQFVNASLENLQRLKSSLLNQAFKGELVC